MQTGDRLIVIEGLLAGVKGVMIGLNPDGTIIFKADINPDHPLTFHPQDVDYELSSSPPNEK